MQLGLEPVCLRAPTLALCTQLGAELAPVVSVDFAVGVVAADTRQRRLDRVLAEGPAALVREHGIGREDDLERTESRRALADADPRALSARARDRGRGQLGTIGSGNHFIELQRVDEIFDAQAASTFGLHRDQVTVLIHSGSRGLGHQVCTDHVRIMDAALPPYGIVLPDRQLACAPLSSPEGRADLAAMAAAANFAFA
jgi:tRNA-splicing ligase RtcB